MTITFVTAFIDLCEERDKRHTPASRFSHFKDLVSMGINIHLFLSNSYRVMYENTIKKSPNVHVEYIELKDLTTYKDLINVQYNLPSTDNPTKDTANYHILINAKIEFVERAIRQNVFPAKHYAWIDFSIGHVFSRPNKTYQYLKDISMKSDLVLDRLYVPGCWTNSYAVNHLFSRISWRFCGGFFVGDCSSLLNFSKLYRAKFKNIIQKNGVLPWEVNIWHYLEIHEGFSPTWIAADHNDSILEFLQNWTSTQ
jgi:Bacterial protein of unknown function (HtrL_YibB)